MSDGLLALTHMTASGEPAACGCDALAADTAPTPPGVEPSQTSGASPVTSAFWEGVIGVEGELTGDGRFIEPNALTWDLPMPLRYVSSDVGEHGGAQVAGRILHTERRPGGLIWASGDYDMASPVGQEAERQVREQLTNGVSMDLDDVSFEVRVAAELVATMDPETKVDMTPPTANADGTITLLKMNSNDEVRATTSARVRAATIVQIPAFASAKIGPASGPPAMPDAMPTDMPVEDSADGLMPDGTTPCSCDDTDPAYDPDCECVDPADEVADVMPPQELLAAAKKGVGNERQLIKWYEHGEGAAKIRWGTPGDFKRCTKIAGKHMEPHMSEGFCARRHKAVTGEWPGPNAHKGGKGKSDHALIAAAAPLSPPSEWFANPHFKAPTALTVTEDGQIFGHLAAWNTCHIGMSHTGCVTAPKSRSGYAYFHTGSIVTAENAEVPVGHITLDTTHAPTTGLSAAGAQNHYEVTGHVVADVVAGEDAHGIWVAGALRPRVSAAQVRELRAAPLSGDWRRVSGNLELVAALAVNVPGFPIPRPKGLVAGGVVQSLVASGMIPPRAVLTPGTEGALSMDDLFYLKRLADRERQEEATLQASGSLPDATDLARRVRASSLAMRVHSTR